MNATSMITLSRIYRRASALIAQSPGAQFLTNARVVTNSAPHAWPQNSEPLLHQRNAAPVPTRRTAQAPLIYAVDDDPELTELYITLLEPIGYNVRTFNDRAEALAVLKAETTKPDLLITDYLGLSMPVGWFMRHCLAAHPTLRILMASGFSQADVKFSEAGPDRFIQKPFTPDELQQEVRAALTA